MFGWVVLAIVVVVIGLVGYFTSDARAIGRWEKAGVNCLPDGIDVDYSNRVPADISIRVNNVFERIPANIGVLKSCLAELHTHDTDGVVHTLVDKTFNLGQFFDVWGKPLMRKKHQLLIAVNGNGYVESEEVFRAIMINDGDQILLEYHSLPVQ